MKILLAISDRELRIEMLSRLKRLGHHIQQLTDMKTELSESLLEEASILFVDERVEWADIAKRLPVAHDAAATSSGECLGSPLPCRVVVLDSNPTVRKAVRRVKQGAWNYVAAPVPVAELVELLGQAEATASYEREKRPLVSSRSMRSTDSSELAQVIVGKSDAMHRVRRMIRIAAKTDANVLIYGETGAGKDLVAAAIHQRSHRAKSPLVKVGCTLLPPSLIESELYGHEEGSFTGAEKPRTGRFEMAAGGTIYLDDVDDVALEQQGKLLRVIEEKVFERVGGTKLIKADVRFIASTKQQLLAKVADGSFRQDLYYRLDVLRLRIPPLRQRREDIAELAEHVLSRLSSKPPTAVDPAVLEVLVAHQWPGNVRELIHAIERAWLVGEGSIRADWLTADLQAMPVANTQVTDLLSSGVPFRDAIDQAEKQLLIGALQAHEGNKTAAARSLGMKASTFRDKLARHRIR